MKKVGQISAGDLESIRAELKGKDWQKHQTPRFAELRSWFIPILTSKGQDNNDHETPFEPCEQGKDFPETLKFRDSLNITPLRTRFMLIQAGGRVPNHYDAIGWERRARLHIPIHTHKSIVFRCGSEKNHMAEGEMWIIDNYDLHGVSNNSDHHRVHLVIDINLNEIEKLNGDV